jgi:hypothetical protein
MLGGGPATTLKGADLALHMVPLSPNPERLAELPVAQAPIPFIEFDIPYSPKSVDTNVTAPAAVAPRWFAATAQTPLWSAAGPDARMFTEVPEGSLMRLDGPDVGTRLQVFYVGDGLTRQAGVAWVDEANVRPVDSPPPGQVPALEALDERRLPDWLQVHRSTTLWSGPDAQAQAFTDLPQWSYLKVAGIARYGRLLVEYGGDFATRQPGLGWVDESAAGPSGDPGRWVRTQQATALWSGGDDQALRFTDLPRDSLLRLVEDGRVARDRVLVEYFGDGRARQPGQAWVPSSDVSPISPPQPLPTPARPTESAAQGQVGATREIQTRTFASEQDFIETIGAAAQAANRTTGVPASVAVAQAILESDWGRSQLSRRGNNLFGIKALSGPGSAGSITLPTWEVIDGVSVRVQAAFKAYFTYQESVEDHGRFFVRNRRYAAALQVGHDPAAFARAIQQAGYATDPAYASKLIRLMDRYNLYRFDAR